MHLLRARRPWRRRHVPEHLRKATNTFPEEARGPHQISDRHMVSRRDMADSFEVQRELRRCIHDCRRGRYPVMRDKPGKEVLECRL